MNQSITDVSGDCLIIKADNVTIDGAGYTIDGDDSGEDYGINVTSVVNLTIYDVIVNDFYQGVYLDNVNDSVLRSINSDSNVNPGEPPDGYGFGLSKSFNVTIQDFTSVDNTYSMSISGGSVELVDGNVSDCDYGDIILYSGALVNLTNISYSVAGPITIADSGSAYFKWHYYAYVNDTAGNAVNGAEVVAYNTTGDLVENFTTGADGWVRESLIDYFYDSAVAYYSNYSLNASASGYVMDSHTFNVTSEENKLDDVFTLSTTGSLTTCANLTLANTEYTLQNDITGISGTCFNITANNVTLDMNGFNITGDSSGSDYGVYVSGYNDTTIKNGMVYEFYHGIYLANNNGNTIKNITANNNEDVAGLGSGISLDLSSNNLISNITVENNGKWGVYISSSSGNTFSNITAENNGDYGIDITSGSLNNTFNKIKIYNHWGGILISGSSNNTFTDGNISDSSGPDVDLTSTSINNTLLNISYDSAMESVAAGSQLIRKWHYWAYVNDSSGNAVQDAYILAYNKTGELLWNWTTNSDGFINQSLTDYENHGGNRNYFSNYTVNATNSTLSTTGHAFNSTNEENYLFDWFTLGTLDTTAPVVIFNYPANASTSTNASLQFNVTITDNINVTNASLYLNSSSWHSLKSCHRLLHSTQLYLEMRY
jgi:parallel beta-helix repeat protein